MALSGSTIASTFLKLLRCNADSMGAGVTASFIQDSADTDSALSISTTRVGIGTASPDAKLEVEGVSANLGINITCYSATDTHLPRLDFYKSAGSTPGTPAATAAGEDLGGIIAYGVNAVNAATAAGQILFEGDAAPADDANDKVPGRMSFWTSDAVSNKQRMTIDDGGNVGIGATTFDGSVAGYLAIKNGTEPSAHTDDQVYIGAKNSAGTGTDTLSTLAIFTEEGVDATALDAVGTLTTRIPIWVNDVAYWLYLDPV